MRRLGYRALALLTVASVLLLSPGRAAEQPETEFDGYLVRLSDPREWNGPVLLSAGTCEEVSDGLYRVEDLETAVRQLEAQGIPCEPVRVDPCTGCRFTFFKDPDGLPLELYEQEKNEKKEEKEHVSL